MKFAYYCPTRAPVNNGTKNTRPWLSSTKANKGSNGVDI